MRSASGWELKDTGRDVLRSQLLFPDKSLCHIGHFGVCWGWATCGLLSSLPRGAQHLPVLGMLPVDGPELHGDTLHGALPWRAVGVKGNPGGKWEKSEVLEEGAKGMDTEIPRSTLPRAVQ